MKILYTEHFRRSYRKLSPTIQKAFDKQIAYLEMNLRHPSLRAKKFDERNGIWQARATKNWRFYFLIDGETVTLLDVIVHPK